MEKVTKRGSESGRGGEGAAGIAGAHRKVADATSRRNLAAAPDLGTPARSSSCSTNRCRRRKGPFGVGRMTTAVDNSSNTASLLACLPH